MDQILNEPIPAPEYPVAGEVRDSKWAEGEAERTNRRVVYPTDFQLQLDIDNEQDLDKFYKARSVIEQFQPGFIKSHSVKESRQVGHWHITVETSENVSDPIKRIMFQAVMGSDWKRELLSYFNNLLNHDPHPTLFFEEK